MSEESRFISHEQFFTFYKDKDEKYHYHGASHIATSSEKKKMNLKQARQKIGLRQTDLDGLTQSEVSKIEKRDDIKMSTLIKYAEALGTEVKITLVSDREEILVLGSMG